MTTPAIILVATLAAVAVAFTVLLFIPQGDGGKTSPPSDGDISIGTPGGVVTVRKVGRVTSVVIHEGIHDHWEGADGVPVPLLPTEATKVHEPALYAEYMSPETSATRKYEIIDEVYSKGFTLPYIGGLNEQYKREMREALSGAASDGMAEGRKPVDLTPERKAPAGNGDDYGKLNINDGLRHALLPEMDGEEADGPGPENQ